jgi:hypothetical protein
MADEVLRTILAFLVDRVAITGRLLPDTARLSSDETGVA